MSEPVVVEFTHDQLWDIANHDYEGATVVDSSNYKDNWYMHYNIIFAYEGLHYEFEYKSHTSPNIHDQQIVSEAKPCVNQPMTVNAEDEARFIWRELVKLDKGHISIDDIMIITELQYDYMVTLGLA